MRYINILCIILIVLMLSGVFVGPLMPLADLLGWLSAWLPGSRSFAALASTTLLFLLFRVLLLPYWVLCSRINRITGKTIPDYETKASKHVLTKQANMRRFTLLLVNSVFYFAVLCVTQHGMATWPVSKEWGLDNAYAEAAGDYSSLIISFASMGFLFFVMSSLFESFFIIISGTVFCKNLLGEKKGKAASGLVAHLDNHTSQWAFSLYWHEPIACCGVVFVTHICFGKHPFIDYMIGSYLLTLLLFAPIWSAASVIMDWRNDRWVASLVRESKEADDPAVRRVAVEKLAKLGQWGQIHYKD